MRKEERGGVLAVCHFQILMLPQLVIGVMKRAAISHCSIFLQNGT